MNLCSVPVFLTYTMIGYDSDADFKPSTMTGVLALVLQSLLNSTHTHVENIAEVIHKLKELAFIGTKEKRVLFSTGELDRYQLKQDDVGDLTVSAPGRNQKLVVLESSQFKTESSLFFNHQSLQEQLTAYFIAEMELEEFKEYLEQNIHTPYYTVVRRLLCGIVLDEKLQRTSQALMKRIPSSEHKAALVQSMQDQLGKCRETNALELLISFNEAGGGLDDVISTHLSVIDVRRVTLSASEAYAVGSVLSRCKYLKMLNMSFCNLNPNLLNIIRSCLKDSNAKIESLDLTANADMGPEGLAAIGEIVKSCELVNLNLQQCNISPVDIQRFNTAVGNAKITKLRLGYNKQMGEEGFFALGEITNRCKVENLELMRCELKAREVETFRKSLEDSKVKIINLSENDTYNQADYVLPVTELTELLPHISETLDLTRSILQPEDEWMLQKKLDELHPTHLKIVIGGKHNLEVLESRKARNLRISDMPSKAHSEDSDLHSCLEKHIWPGEGGLIELHGCSLQFPPNTLDAESNIKICVVIDPTVPDDYKAISPSLSSKISGAQLNEGSSIEAVLLAWCYADRTGALFPTTVGVDLLCRESEAGQWSRVRSVNLEKDRKVRFKTSKVCDYVLGIKRTDFPTLSLNYPVHARITYNALGKVRVYIYIADEGTVEEVERVCKNDGFKQALDQKTFTTKIWNDHKFELLCTSSPEEFAIVGDQSTFFFFNGDLKHKGFVQFELRLEPLPKRKTGRFLEFDFKIYVCHLLDHGSSFRIPWEISPELTIGPEGGKIDVEDCSISFPHNSLHLPSNISISPHLDSKRFPIPPGYAPICPILQCEPSGLKFANPAMITLPSWIETSFPLPVDIFCGKIRDGSLVWGREATVALDRGRGIEFSCNHFTPYFAGIVLDAIKLYLGFIYDIRPYLYQRSEGRFCAGVCVNNLTKIREIEEDMESHGYTSVFPRLNSVRVNLNENIEIDLKCSNEPEVDVTAPPEKKVSINQEFARTLESPMYFSLPKPKDGDTEQFLLQFSVKGVVTHICQNFRYYWKDERDSGVNIQHAGYVNVQQ